VICKVSKVKSFPSHKAHKAVLISVSLAKHQLTLWDHGYRASVSCRVSVYSPAFAGTHCAYQKTDGQAELTRVAGYIPRWFTRLQKVTHPSTNRARHRVTSLIDTNALLLNQTATASWSIQPPKSDCSLVHACPTPYKKFHQNAFVTFWVILQTDRQTDRQAKVKT